ncbi:hypothetical protein K491DRAFT_273682 [Lophiostoma macrostomum CBS 122681]|uniref:Uncharacterized protein n=1 Tax=Lophiostoma macrostomum CBS 122681 TaxID=1314788 RepID=A0A6A6SJ23_9PLEO|nr:hypothetical protein K491DRAFT_273682 [Lophiostoma macrostomum CBS 122681]
MSEQTPSNDTDEEALSRLDDLLHMAEDARTRYFKLMSKKDIEGMVRAILREKQQSFTGQTDLAANRRNSNGRRASRPVQAGPCDRKRDRVSQVTLPDDENRTIVSGHTEASDRVQPDRVENQNQIIDQDEPRAIERERSQDAPLVIDLSDDASTESKTPIVPDSDYEPPKSIKTPTSKKRRTSGSLSRVELEKMLWLPDHSTSGHWGDMADLSVRTADIFKEHFRNHYVIVRGKSTRYFNYCRDSLEFSNSSELDEYRVRNDCLGSYVFARPNVKYGEPAQDQTVACNGCIKRRILCARLMEKKGKLKLGIFPRPEKDRADVSWTEIAYWAVEKIY